MIINIFKMLTPILIMFAIHATDTKVDIEEQSNTRPPRLLILGVDGIFPPFFEDMLNDGELPNFEKVRKASAWTLKGKTVYRPHSLIAWSALLYGREPTIWQKIKDCFSREGVNRPEVATRNHGKANLCSALGGKESTTVITNWGNIGGLVSEEGVTITPNQGIIPDNETFNDVVPFEKGTSIRTSTIDYPGNDQKDIEVFKKINKALDDGKYTTIFAQLDYSDWIAQNSDWTVKDKVVKNALYTQCLKDIDTELGKLLDSKKIDLTRDYLCITSDHGRHSWFSLSCLIPPNCAPGIKHDCFFCSTVQQIPVFVAGPGITHHEITDKISIVDIVPSLLALFGKDKGDMEGKEIDFKGKK